jgi:hypothetical protein
MKKREEQTLQGRTAGNTIKTIRDFSRPVQIINICRQPLPVCNTRRRQNMERSKDPHNMIQWARVSPKKLKYSKLSEQLNSLEDGNS